MTIDWGGKITKAGYDVDTDDIRNLLLSSKYPMLKYHMDSNGQVTFDPGDTHEYVDFTHNLGYVPAFIAYIEHTDGKQYFIPHMPRGVGYEWHDYAYADSTKVRCGRVFDTGAYNQYEAEPISSTDYYDSRWGVTGFFLMGKKVGLGRGGALRFSNVFVPKNASIISANLIVAVQWKGEGTGDINERIYGIDQDNTDDFDGDNPMIRPRTDAYTNHGGGIPPAGQYMNPSVTSIVQEIVNRGSWASGNHMGFVFDDIGSADEVWLEDDYGTGINSKLQIKYGSPATVKFRAIIFKDKIA